MARQSISHFPLSWATLVLSASALFIAVAFTFYGFDFTDEGFYLNSYKYLASYPAFNSLFGFVYSVPFRLLGESLPAIRIFNILTLYFTGYWLILCSTRSLPVNAPFSQGERFLFVAPSLSAFSLLGLGLYSTPSYNHLAFIGCMLVAGSIYIAASKATNHESDARSFFITLSIGLLIAFLGKPTTGLALSLIIAIFILSCNRSIRLLTLFSFLFTALILFVFLVFTPGGASLTISKLSFGKQVGVLLADGHSIEGLARSVLQFLSLPAAIPFIGIVIIQILICLLCQKYNDIKSRRFAWIALSFLLLPLISFYAISFAVTRPDRMTLALPQFWLVALPFTCFVLWVLKIKPVDQDRWIDFQGSYALFLAILLIPVCYGFGTNTGMWSKALSASLIYVSLAVFWGVNFLGQYSSTYTRPFIVLAFIGFVLASPSFLGHYALPQRQPQPLWKNANRTVIGSSNSQVLLDQSFSTYINDLKTSLLENGFRPGDPILDLTGQSPGLIYAVSGRLVGYPWLIGGRLGSNDMASALLARIPTSELEASWILDEPDGPQRINPPILQKIGIDLGNSTRYKPVGIFDVPKAAGGFFVPRTQVLYKSLPRLAPL